MLLFILSDDTQTTNSGSSTGSPTVSGWTELHSGTARSAGGDCSAFLFWKVAGASESNATVTWSANTQGLTHVVEISGQDGTTPIDGSNYTTTASGQTSATVTGFTTTVDGCLLVALAGVDESNANYAPYWADPMVSGWTARYGSSSVPNTLGGSATYSGIATTTQSTAGATGNITCTIAAQNDAIVAYLVAVAPADTGTSANAGAASGTGAGHNAVAALDANAEAASGAGVGHDATVSTGQSDTGLVGLLAALN